MTMKPSPSPHENRKVGAPALLWLGVGVVAIAGIAQAAYVIRMGRTVEALSARLERQADEGPGSEARGARPDVSVPILTMRHAQLPPPAAEGELPALPEPIASDQARELMRRFVAAEIERVRQQRAQDKKIKNDEKKEKKTAQRAKGEAEQRDKLTKELGLVGPDALRVTDLLTNSEKTRKTLRDAERAGQSSPADTAAALTALREQTQRDLRNVLGDRWSARLQEAQKKLQDVRKTEQDTRNNANGPFWFMANPPGT